MCVHVCGGRREMLNRQLPGKHKFNRGGKEWVPKHYVTSWRGGTEAKSSSKSCQSGKEVAAVMISGYGLGTAHAKALRW